METIRIGYTGLDTRYWRIIYWIGLDWIYQGNCGLDTGGDVDRILPIPRTAKNIGWIGLGLESVEKKNVGF